MSNRLAWILVVLVAAQTASVAGSKLFKVTGKLYTDRSCRPQAVPEEIYDFMFTALNRDGAKLEGVAIMQCDDEWPAIRTTLRNFNVESDSGWSGEPIRYRLVFLWFFRLAFSVSYSYTTD